MQMFVFMHAYILNMHTRFYICMYRYSYKYRYITFQWKKKDKTGNQMDNGIFCCNIIVSMTQCASLLWFNVLNESCCLNFCCCQLSLSGDSFSQLWHYFGIAWDLEIRSRYNITLNVSKIWRSSTYSHMKAKNELVFPPQLTVLTKYILLVIKNMKSYADKSIFTFRMVLLGSRLEALKLSLRASWQSAGAGALWRGLQFWTWTWTGPGSQGLSHLPARSRAAGGTGKGP